MAKVHDTPSDVSAEEGHVHIDGPDGVVVSLTPDAAAETSDRLLHEAGHAQGQQIASQRDEEERAARRR